MGQSASNTYAPPQNEDEGNQLDVQQEDDQEEGEEQREQIGEEDQPQQQQEDERTTRLLYGSPYFRSPLNDDWIFGESSRPLDAAAVSALGGTVRILPPRATKKKSIKCPFNLRKASLQLIPMDETKKHYSIQFVFDSTESCSIKVYYTAETQSDQQSKFSPDMIGTSIFDKGMAQVYQTKGYLDASLYKESELKEPNVFPVIIVLESEKFKEVVSQTTYATLLHCADDSWEIKPLKQKLWLNGKSFVIHEIFGVENETDGRECVICMTESRGTTVLPCRHLCLCSTCAEKLRLQSNKCPICRSTIKSMIEIQLSKAEEDIALDEETVLTHKKSKHVSTKSKLEEV